MNAIAIKRINNQSPEPSCPTCNIIDASPREAVELPEAAKKPS
jgi:hypothetical protein